MRRVLPLTIILALLPSAIHFVENRQHHPSEPAYHYAGRGFINPPTVYEMQQTKCLATMIYGEARGEPQVGQVAVAYTAMNRAATKTVCNVVLAPKQYSIFNDNPALRAAALSLHVEPKQKNIIDKAGWALAMNVADDVIMGRVPDPTKGATHYLSPTAMAAFGYEYPQWSREYKLVTVINNHKFYRKV